MKKIFIILTVIIITACASDLPEEAADVIAIIEESIITTEITANEHEVETVTQDEYVHNAAPDVTQISDEFTQPHEHETEISETAVTDITSMLDIVTQPSEQKTEIVETTASEVTQTSDEFTQSQEQKTEISETTIPEVTQIPTEIIPPSDFNIELFLQNMTLKQKVGQMFFQAFRQDNNGRNITRINQHTIDIINNYNIGGVILFSENIESAQQVTDYIKNLHAASSLPLFISIDEEGGRVLRTKSLNVPRIESALTIGSTGDAQNAYNAAQTIAKYLSPLGFNVNFAPVADVFTNPVNTVIGDRAFAKDAHEAAEMVKYFTRGLLDNNILPALKHFPGHGDTLADSHFGSAETKKTLDELSECEFIPFQAGINAGAPFVMTGHISTPNITGNNEPALFSRYLLRDILRNTLGFDGIIITDALNMGAVIKYYNPAQTAVKSVLAGVDILLMPANLEQAYNGILRAVESGEITEARIDESVRRILTVKYQSGIIK